MTVREKAALVLLGVAFVALTGAGYGLGALFGAGWPTAAAVAGGLALAGGLSLGLGGDEEATVSWLDVMDAWATAEDDGPLDFEGIPVPERMQQLIGLALD